MIVYCRKIRWILAYYLIIIGQNKERKNIYTCAGHLKFKMSYLTHPNLCNQAKHNCVTLNIGHWTILEIYNICLYNFWSRNQYIKSFSLTNDTNLRYKMILILDTMSNILNAFCSNEINYWFPVSMLKSRLFTRTLGCSSATWSISP